MLMVLVVDDDQDDVASYDGEVKEKAYNEKILPAKKIPDCGSPRPQRVCRRRRERGAWDWRLRGLGVRHREGVKVQT